MYSYSEQAEDVQHYNASIEGEIDAKINSFKHIKRFLWNFGKLNSTEQVLEKTLNLKWTNPNISNGFHEISVH